MKKFLAFLKAFFANGLDEPDDFLDRYAEAEPAMAADVAKARAAQSQRRPGCTLPDCPVCSTDVPRKRVSRAKLEADADAERKAAQAVIDALKPKRKPARKKAPAKPVARKKKTPAKKRAR